MPHRFCLTRPEPPEHAIQDAVLRFLMLDRRVAWARRFNTGAVCIEGCDARGRRSRRFVRYAFPGCSDILGQLASGHFLACEVKRPSTRPTPEQAAFLEQVRCNGGLACIARGVDDMQRALDGFFAESETDRVVAATRGLVARRPPGTWDNRVAGHPAATRTRSPKETVP